MPPRSGIAILGGSFNPVHIGHLRLAIEVYENLPVERVDMVPAFFPPHKQDQDMLPFAQRVAMLEEAVSGLNGIAVNTLEAERPGPSYTWDTLGMYQAGYPNAPLYFILSLQDLTTLPIWHRGPDLIARATLLVAPRHGEAVTDFQAVLQNIWENCCETPALPGCKAAFRVNCLAGQGVAALLKWTPLEISSTDIRLRLDQGKDIRFLVPDSIVPILTNGSC